MMLLLLRRRLLLLVLLYHSLPPLPPGLVDFGRQVVVVVEVQVLGHLVLVQLHVQSLRVTGPGSKRFLQRGGQANSNTMEQNNAIIFPYWRVSFYIYIHTYKE